MKSCEIFYFLFFMKRVKDLKLCEYSLLLATPLLHHKSVVCLTLARL